MRTYVHIYIYIYIITEAVSFEPREQGAQRRHLLKLDLTFNGFIINKLL